MITSLTIDNFQAHEHSTVAFKVPGITAITGPSDSGKSAILRALRVALFGGKSSGLVRTGKNKLAVKLLLEDNIVVSVARGPSENSYTVSQHGRADSEFNKAGQDVPDGVREIFNVTGLNFQGQHDGPYLLNLSGAERASVLADLTNSSVFVSAVKEANRIKLDADRSSSACMKRLEAVTGQLSQYPSAAELSARSAALKNAEFKLAAYEQLRDTYTEIFRSVETLDNYDKVISEQRNLSAPPDHLRTLLQDYEVKRNELVTLTSALDEVTVMKEDLGYLTQITEEKHAVYEKLLAEKPDEFIVCPSCGEKISV